jgi:hypothetical protein
VLDQRTLVWIHTSGHIHLVVQQFDQPSPSTADVEDTGIRLNVSTNGRLIYLPALTPPRMGSRVKLAETVLAVEIERSVIPR